MPTTKEILQKYSQKIEGQMNGFGPQPYSREYMQFKQDMLPELTKYKRWAETLGRIIKIKVSDKNSVKIQRYLNIAHIDLDPSKATGLALMSFLLAFF